MAGNSIIGGNTKWRERMADHLAVTEPVGRQIGSTHVLHMAIGALAGFLAGWVLSLTSVYAALGWPTFTAAIVLASWQALQGARVKSHPSDPQLIEQCVMEHSSHDER